MKYRFPLDFDRSSHKTSNKINHRSAINYSQHVDTYLTEEIDNDVMLGLFTVNPYWQSSYQYISPFMTHKKSNSVNTRVIIGESVNSGVAHS